MNYLSQYIFCAFLIKNFNNTIKPYSSELCINFNRLIVSIGTVHKLTHSSFKTVFLCQA